MFTTVASLLSRKIIKISLGIIAGSFLLFLLLHLLFPLKLLVSYSQIITARDGSVLHGYLSHDDKWRMKTELKEIIPQLSKTIIYKEDKYFYYHPGINPVAIVRAGVNNILKGKTTSGASTITMQVARLLSPKKRTYANKVVEIFRALQLEWQFSKEEILQLYLNLVPYGGNVEGVKSASLLYFGRLPDQLSLAQIATLSIVPNRPTSLGLGKNEILLLQERNKWLKRFERDNLFPEKEIQDALLEPLEARRRPVPKVAPHFSYRLKSQFPKADQLPTTLNPAMQQKVQQLAYNYSKRLQRYNINNLAVLVLNNRTMEVEAYIGSPDYSDQAHAGQVDGVKAIRSPGSTLKPLIYAMGIDMGKITPKTILTDVPSSFAGYNPDNFDKKFNGRVSVEKALSYSLNIPAVKVLHETGLPIFIDKLKRASFRQIDKDENKLGLSVALGGCGVTLEELTGLFASFANNGYYRPLRYLTQPKPVTPDTARQVRIVSPEAAFMIHEILTQASRPDLPNNYQNSYHVPKVAWKTGTSYGRRDAWSIGYNATYTVGVWVGNASGEGVRELTGADIATPLLFTIFNTIDYNSTNQWFSAPKSLAFRLVCTETGLAPDDFCKNQAADYFIPLVSSTQKCTHEKEVAISINESFSYCTTCQPAIGFKKKRYPNLTPDLIAYYDNSGIVYEKIPRHNPTCTRIFDSQAPLIVSPVQGQEYFIDSDSPPELMLSCQADNEVKQVYWFINDQFYVTANAAEKVFFKPATGPLKISCSDDKGRNSDVQVKVRAE
ncbi:penicillin-binding protein 1C [Rhodocytophaga rosea]|uniref:peptidoglycan glycosyltransferase n=1 Tax=Rhodocytophaga rosea TaxID=2704465 RepID=A0A6C0GLR9_9BACT|nr:penicillin-binding protein 1C [Rhodocytophaga rosea]QHT68572.1 penicillin-binding protein 1C [Rhodocytophaga rosea]